MSVTTLPRCPECGWDIAQPAGAFTPGMRRRRRTLVLLLAFLPPLVVLGWTAWVSRPNGFSYGSSFPRFLDPAVSLSDVRRIADGHLPETLKPGDLVRRLIAMTRTMHPQTPGRRSIEAGFAPAATTRSRTRSIGWPFAWVTISRDLNYVDAVARTGFVAARTNPSARPLGMYEGPSDPLNVPPGPRWRWQGMGLRFQVQPEEAGGVFTVYQVKPPAMLLTVLLGLGAWWILIAAASWWFRKARRQPPRWLGWLVLGLLVLVCAGLALATSGSRERSPYVFAKTIQASMPPAPVYWTREGFSRLSIDADGLRALRDRADGDRVLAAELLRSAPQPAGDPDRLYIAATSDPEAVLTPESRMLTLAHAFPIVSLTRESYIRRPDFGAAEAMAPRGGLRLGFEYGGLLLYWSRAVAGASTYWISINLEMLSLFLVGPLVLAFAAHAWCRGILVRRRARGLCPRCCYQVTMSSP